MNFSDLARDQTSDMGWKQRGHSGRKARTAKEERAPMWSSRFTRKIASSRPRVAARSSGRRPVYHSVHSRSGGSRWVCLLHQARFHVS